MFLGMAAIPALVCLQRQSRLEKYEICERDITCSGLASGIFHKSGHTVL